MVVVVLLLVTILSFAFSLNCLIGQWLDIVIVGLVTRVHDCDLLPIDLEIWLIGLPKSSGCFLRRKELYECEILESSSQLVLDLPYISHWRKCLKDLQQSALLYLSHHWSPKHQTAILG